MSRRNEYLNSLEESKSKMLDSLSEKSKETSVDQMIDDFEKNSEELVSTEQEKKEVAQDAIVLTKNFSLNLKAKEAKTVHKNFLIPKSINDKLAGLSAQSGVSENEIVNEIFKKAFVG